MEQFIQQNLWLVLLLVLWQIPRKERKEKMDALENSAVVMVSKITKTLGVSIEYLID